jgi:hypothetical protein
MRKRLVCATVLIFVATAGIGFGATAYHTFYPRQVTA